MSGQNRIVQSENELKNEGEDKLTQDLDNANEVAAKIENK